MDGIQAGILAPVPALARYLTFSLLTGARPGPALEALGRLGDGDATVVGIGNPLVRALGRRVEGLVDLAARSAAGIAVPSTPAAVWCWLRGDDRGELVHRTRSLRGALAGILRVDEVVDAFRYDIGRDLTGYEDGTENPEGEAALEAAFVAGRGSGLDGSSFVAVQRWRHDLDLFESFSPAERDETVGRRRESNEEIEDAPASAHVKRTAQEDFEPPAFVLRRSMPWADATGEGLVFTAFGHGLGAFERLLARMLGEDDGIVDAMFRFTRPLTGACFWCPPVRAGMLDLSALGG